MQSFTKSQNLTLLLLRLSIAAIFIVAGYAKFGLWSASPDVMPAPMLLLMRFLSIAEPLGGLALLVGYLTRTASICLAIIMVGAIAVLQFQMNIGFATATGAGWNFPLAILSDCFILAAFGAGDWSLETMWKKS